MAREWTTTSTGTEARTSGVAAVIGHEFVARVSSTDHLPGAEALLQYVVELAADTGASVSDGESVWYGFTAVRFCAEDDTLRVHDEDDDRGQRLVDNAVEVFEIQRLTCDEAGSEFLPPSADALGIVSPGLREGDDFEMVRYPSPDHMSGWWFLADRYDGDASRLEGHHLAHITEWRPEVLPYVALAPGSVVTVGPEGEDVSFDETLLEGRGAGSGPTAR